MATHSGRSLLTYEEFRELPDDGKRYELIDGELCEMPSPTWMHQIVVHNIESALRRAVDVPCQGVVVHDFDIVFSRFKAVRPDVVFISPGRQGLSDVCLVGAPDLAVEVLSPGNRRHDLVRKLAWYDEYGAAEYWIVDVDLRTVTVYKRKGEHFGQPGVFGDEDTLGTQLIPSLHLPVAAVFAGLP